MFLALVCIKETEERKKGNERWAENHRLSLVRTEEDSWGSKETSPGRQAGGSSKYSCRKPTVGMAPSRGAAGGSKDTKLRLCAELETSPPINTALWKPLEQSGTLRSHVLTPTPRPGTVSRNKRPRKRSSLEFVFKISLLCVNLHIVAFLQQGADHWACCCLSLSRGRLTVIEKRLGHLMFTPRETAWPWASDSGPAFLLL